MRPFNYTSAATLDETLQLLGQDGDGSHRPLAGGTDLLPLMKADITAPIHLIDIKRMGELPQGISENGKWVTLGALTTLSEIEQSELIGTRYPLLAEAAALAATPQLRNMATLGGNLLQRPRCWYFRHAHFHCWLKGGDECHAVDGQNQMHAILGNSPCVAAHPSDLPTALLALGAEVQLRGPQGQRILPLDEFFMQPEAGRRLETVVEPDELILSVRLPLLPEGTRSAYVKAMDRKVWAFALVSVAALLRLEGNVIREARLVLGGVATIPWRVPAAERVLEGQAPSAEVFARAADAALADAHPLEHNDYKVPLAKSLIVQALQAVVSQ